jgi:hypothetical protein
VVLAHRAVQASSGEVLVETYLARQLAPRGLLLLEAQRAYVAQPLYFGERAPVVAVFELGPQNGAVYEALRAQISAALEALTHAAGQTRFREVEADTLRPIADVAKA